MKALSREQYAALLEQYIALLEAEMAALRPSWEVPCIRQSYAQAEAHAALHGVWETGQRELAYEAYQARQAQRWGEAKTQHMYL